MNNEKFAAYLNKKYKEQYPKSKINLVGPNDY